MFKNMIVVIVFNLCVLVCNAKVFEKNVPISKVTIFKDRAFVKLRIKLDLKKGEQSINFNDLT